MNDDQAPTALSPEAADAVAAICLMAAFADGDKSSEEQTQLKDIFESLGGVKTAALYQRVMLGNTTLEEEILDLPTTALRGFAFELAVGICDADGATNEAEAAFLERLRHSLQIPGEAAHAPQHEAEELAALPVMSVLAPPAPTSSVATLPDDPELDKLILNAAILNGGLELLPQSLATVAIVPLQLRMVYQIGQANGYQLDREHLREFLAIAGVGMTSQVVEGHLRKLFGGLAKRAAGRGARQVVSTATGAAMSFATTYGLGQAAKRYYSGRRKLALSEVRSIFQEQLVKGQSLFETYRGDVQTKASTVNLQSLMKMVR